MVRGTALVVGLLALMPSTMFGQSPWTAVAEALMESVLYLETESGACTGFVINQEKQYVLTAAHCDGEKLLAGNEPVTLVAKDRKRDWMILEMPSEVGPEVKLAEKDPKIGEEVASLGFGMGLERPIFRLGHVSDTEMRIPEIDGVFIAIDAPFVGGQSGGPVVNQAGELVMLVQRASPQTGIGIGVEELRKRIKKYLPKP